MSHNYARNSKQKFAYLVNILYLCLLICVNMRKQYIIPFLLLALTLSSCQRHATPKPYGYFRIDTPDTAYHYASLANYPYTFKLSDNAQVTPHFFEGENYWIDIVYPSLNTTIHCSYKPIRNNLRTLSRDAQEFLFSHSTIASAIPAQEFAHPEQRVYGVYSELHGNTASPMQFILTDSIEHFFRASVYCNTIPNQDSLAPIYDYIRHDVSTIMESIQLQ